jgi:hypothetical protein
MRHSVDNNDNKGQLRESATFSQLLPRHAGENHSQTLASRRQRTTPAPIQVIGGLKPVPHRPNLEPVSDEVSPLSPIDITEFMEFQRGGSSMYTEDYCVSGKPEPLAIRPYTAGNGVSQSVQQETAVAGDSIKERPLQPPSTSHHLQANPSHRPSRGQGNGDEALRYVGGSPLEVAFRQESKKARRVDSPLFSPFPFYFRGQDFPAEKRGEKILIGEKGWLERTDKLDKEAKSSSKKLGILDGIKKIARDVVSKYRAITHFVEILT